MERQYFNSSDFYLSVFLMANNHKLVDFYRRNGYTTFIFLETPELTELVKNYYSESTLIEPQRYGRSVKQLKSLIHQASLSTVQTVNDNEFSNKLKGTE